MALLLLPVEVGVAVGVGQGVAVTGRRATAVELSSVGRSKYWLRMSEGRQDGGMVESEAELNSTC